MARLEIIAGNKVQGVVKDFYDSKGGEAKVVNVFKGLANSPLGILAFKHLEELNGQGTLTNQEKEAVKLTASQYNQCKYCLSAHTLSAKASGLSEEAIDAIRKGDVTVNKQQALINFTVAILKHKGRLSEDDFNAFKAQGYTDENVVEVLILIATKTLTNYFNNLNQTDIDLPVAKDI